jgi:hypothetical protein
MLHSVSVASTLLAARRVPSGEKATCHICFVGPVSVRSSRASIAGDATTGGREGSRDGSVRLSSTAPTKIATTPNLPTLILNAPMQD